MNKFKNAGVLALLACTGLSSAVLGNDVEKQFEKKLQSAAHKASKMNLTEMNLSGFKGIAGVSYLSSFKYEVTVQGNWETDANTSRPVINMPAIFEL